MILDQHAKKMPALRRALDKDSLEELAHMCAFATSLRDELADMKDVPEHLFREKKWTR